MCIEIPTSRIKREKVWKQMTNSTVYQRKEKHQMIITSRANNKNRAFELKQKWKGIADNIKIANKERKHFGRLHFTEYKFTTPNTRLWSRTHAWIAKQTIYKGTFYVFDLVLLGLILTSNSMLQSTFETLIIARRTQRFCQLHIWIFVISCNN